MPSKINIMLFIESNEGVEISFLENFKLEG